MTGHLEEPPDKDVFLIRFEDDKLDLGDELAVLLKTLRYQLIPNRFRVSRTYQLNLRPVAQGASILSVVYILLISLNHKIKVY